MTLLRLALLAAITTFLAACSPGEERVSTHVVALPAPQAAVPPGHPPAQGRMPGAVIDRLGLALRATPGGLAVTAIDLDGPAAQAGVQAGDVVVGADGVPAADAEQFRVLADAAQDTLHLDLRRGGAARRVAVRLGSPESIEAAWTPFGLQVRDLPDSARKALGLSHGVMVTKVRAPADRTRILPGDVIVAVGEEKVRSAEEFGRLAAARRGAIGLHVRRADSDLFIPLEPGEGRNAASAPGDASRGGGAPRPEERYRKPIDKPLRT